MKGIVSNHVIFYRSNYALRAKRLKRHEKGNTLKLARRANQNTKELFVCTKI